MKAKSKYYPFIVEVTNVNDKFFSGTVVETKTLIYPKGYWAVKWLSKDFEFISDSHAMNQEVLATKQKETKDSIVESVINQFKQRSEVGIKKYGVTLDRTDIDVLGWVKHLQEELQDGILYLERLKKELESKK